MPNSPVDTNRHFDSTTESSRDESINASSGWKVLREMKEKIHSSKTILQSILNRTQTQYHSVCKKIGTNTSLFLGLSLLFFLHYNSVHSFLIHYSFVDLSTLSNKIVQILHMAWPLNPQKLDVGLVSLFVAFLNKVKKQINPLMASGFINLGLGMGDYSYIHTIFLIVISLAFALLYYRKRKVEKSKSSEKDSVTTERPVRKNLPYY